MLNIYSLGNVMDALVPISRFNRGEANKIFEEVKETGCKIVVKNNNPACVLLTPEKYREMVELIDDQYLLALAVERERNFNGKTYSADEVYGELEIEMDIDDEIPMEYGIDFE